MNRFSYSVWNMSLSPNQFGMSTMTPHTIEQKIRLVTEVLYALDPIGLRAHGCPADEYTSEATYIVFGVEANPERNNTNSLDSLAQLVFESQFSPDLCKGIDWASLALAVSNQLL